METISRHSGDRTRCAGSALVPYLAWCAASAVGGCSGGASAAGDPASQRTVEAEAPGRDTAEPVMSEKRWPGDGSEPGPPLLSVPVLGLGREALRDNFGEARGARRHEGIDILMPLGTPVLAAVDGWVWEMKWDERGGRTVYVLELSGRYILLYAHLDAYAEGVAVGRPVRRGEVLGYVGATGNVAGSPHLHLRVGRIRSPERWWEDDPIDPYPLLVEALGG